MVMQVVAMCFWYNGALTFKALHGALPNGEGVASVFQNLLQVLQIVAKHDFEYRRFIFGLTAIVTLSPNLMPELIAKNVPLIMKELAGVAEKMRKERVKILKNNEKYLQEEADRRKKGEQGDDSEEEGDGFVDEEASDESNEELEGDDE
jgi:hypothetical protein